jgi:hypothetical protein
MAVQCVYVTSQTGGAGVCYARGGARWATGALNIASIPGVKEGLRKVWVGTNTGNLITLDAWNGHVSPKESDRRERPLKILYSTALCY